jgi:hypothetical protein
MNNKHKVIAAAIFLLIWAVLVAFKMVPSQGLVDMLRDMILGMGLYHAVLKKPGG